VATADVSSLSDSAAWALMPGYPIPLVLGGECHVAFSLGGPFAVEVWQAIPGTPLDVPEAGGVHHIGCWVDYLAAEARRLDALPAEGLHQARHQLPPPAPRRASRLARHSTAGHAASLIPRADPRTAAAVPA